MKRNPFLFLLCFSLLQWPALAAAGSAETNCLKAALGTQQPSEIIAACWSSESNEATAWKQIRAGQKADFNEKYGGALDPVSSWHQDDREKRRLDPHFIQMLLTREAFTKEIPNTGVHIVGAVFEKVLDLSNTRIAHRLVIEKSRLERGVHFQGLKSSAGISFEGSFFDRDLKMSRAQIKGDLTLSHVGFGFGAQARGLPFVQALKPTPSTDFSRDLYLRGVTIDGSLTMDDGRFYSVDLQMARIKGQLDMRNATFKGPLHMALAHEIYEIKMRSCTFEKDVFLPGVQVKSNLLLGGATFKEKLDLEGAKIGLNLSMANGKFGEVDLRRATVGGQLRIGKIGSKHFSRKSEFGGKVIMYGLVVADQLYMEKAVFKDQVRMHGVHVKGNLSFKESTFKGDLNLKGAHIERDVYLDRTVFTTGQANLLMEGVRIDGNLVLDNADFKGATGSPKFDLSLATVGVIQYRGSRSLPLLDLSGTHVEKIFVSRNKSLWPEHIKLHGFEYSQFIFEQPKSKDRQAKYEDWLSRLNEYTPQPYMQAAKVMRQNGYPEVADQILYAGKNQELRKTQSFWGKLGLYILKGTIGFGIYKRIGLFWVIGFLILGTIIAYIQNIDARIEEFRKPKHDSPKTMDGGNTKGEQRRITKRTIIRATFYSLDILLPIIRLKYEHDRIDLERGAEIYFYFHKMFGWFLATILVSSLTGLINPFK